MFLPNHIKNIKSRHILLALIFFLCFSNGTTLYAEPSSHVITASQWQHLHEDRAFNYKKDKELIRKPEPYNPSALTKFFDALFAFLNSGLGLFLVWTVVIGIVSFIIYKLFFSNDSVLFGKNKRALDDTGEAADEENIFTTNWELLLHHAMSANDLKLAVRYSYMWLLQILQERELIKYRSDKTNYEYYTELGDTNYKQPFRQLSRQYEFAWYSPFGMPQEIFNEYITLFNNFRHQLGR